MKNEKLVLDHLPLANSIAWKKNQKTPKNVMLEDLKSVAYFALVKAADNYNSDLGSFCNYARIRINGDIIDYLRNFILTTNRFKPTEDLEFVENSNRTQNTKDFFDFIFSKLNRIESTILRMYYLENKTMKEIGVLHGICESRISQILKKCHSRIKYIKELS